jgi:methyl-accepting chemotaxis protein
VKRVTDIIAEISAASQEQASGIDQVNKAVMQMDQGTQQNAALVEQATSASQSMKQQAEDLLQQVAFFKTNEEGMASSPQGTMSHRNASTRLAHKAPSVGKSSKAANKGQTESVRSIPQPVSVSSSNGHGQRKSDDDFFEEF